MNLKNPFRNEKTEALIIEFKRTATRMESLLRKIPTTDAKILGELYALSMRIEHMVATDPGHEKNSMFLEQARRLALFQRQRYNHITHSGKLRNTP